ncbi:hypothetical protein D3C80_1689620 [compost metagenome]
MQLNHINVTRTHTSLLICLGRSTTGHAGADNVQHAAGFEAVRGIGRQTHAGNLHAAAQAVLARVSLGNHHHSSCATSWWAAHEASDRSEDLRRGHDLLQGQWLGKQRIRVAQGMAASLDRDAPEQLG